MPRVEIQEGDLTEASVDAIVNAANTDLVLGSGVAGAIRDHAGPSVQAACDAHGPIRLGDVAVTEAGALPARWILHAAGMEPGGKVDEDTLRACTRRALEIAAERGFESLAFPAIGTGVGGLSMQRCAEVMLSEVHAFLDDAPALARVRFVLYGEPAYRVFEQVADAEKIRRQMERLGR